MKKRPSICFVSLPIYPVLDPSKSLEGIGGAEVQQRFLIHELVRRGFDVSVITRDYGQPDEQEINGVRILKTCSASAGLPLLRQFHPRTTSLWRCMKAVNADIYYQRTASFNTGVVAHFCRKHSKRFIFSVAHDNDVAGGRVSRGSKRRFSVTEFRDRKMFEYGLKTADQIVVQNTRQGLQLRNGFGLESTEIKSTYKPNKLPVAEPSDTILWVARLLPWKRPEIFIRLAKQFPEYSFILIGGTDDKNYYRSLALQADNANCQMTGFLHYEEVEKYFDQARLFVNTSDAEGFPNTFLQALARGIPILSSVDPSGIIGKHHLGHYCESIEAFSHHLAAFMDNSELHRDTSIRCKNHFAQHHAPDLVGQHYETLLMSMA